MKTNPEQNKQNAVAFYDLMFNQCQPEEAIQQYVGDVHTQHNPHVADGKVAFIEQDKISPYLPPPEWHFFPEISQYFPDYGWAALA